MFCPPPIAMLHQYLPIFDDKHWQCFPPPGHAATAMFLPSGHTAAQAAAMGSLQVHQKYIAVTQNIYIAVIPNKYTAVTPNLYFAVTPNVLQLHQIYIFQLHQIYYSYTSYSFLVYPFPSATAANPKCDTHEHCCCCCCCCRSNPGWVTAHISIYLDLFGFRAYRLILCHSLSQMGSFTMSFYSIATCSPQHLLFSF